MKKHIVLILILVFAFTVGLIGCEKKAEQPKPESQQTVTPVTPPPAPEPAPIAPPPAPPKPAKK